MTATTPETLTFGGVLLNTFAQNVESIAGRLTPPARRTNNVPIPGRHGTLHVPDKVYDENVVALPLWVKGCAADGTIPVGSTERKQFFDNLDALAAIFSQPGLQALVWTLPDGSKRRVMAEVLESFDPSMTGQNLAKFTVNLVCPQPFWEDLNPLVGSYGVTTSGATIHLTHLDGGTAPIDDAVFTLTGPWTAPEVIDSSTGDSFSDSSSVLSGQALVIDGSEWTILLDGSNDLTHFAHTGTRFLQLVPNVSQQYQVECVGSGFTHATALQVSARRRFLLG